MKLKNIGSNQTAIDFGNGCEVFFSYNTPVAAFVPGRGYIKTDTYHSNTTSRHINKWTEGRAESVPQEEIDRLANSGGQYR